ncbi:unnamed protein product [Echinostoma caproni]|uniref:UmuC domain-containing protein n=1 Tax=Echinostoma caproni TaxID=27848 RepID=A0A183BFT6_9TREM|nr:unnamed protein product [Echinostoma caproni]
MNRIIILIDMDCFYVQVEQREQPETQNKPCAVAQYNGSTGGGIIAVSYEARARGVKRGMWGKTALKTCDDLILFEVPEKRGKADLAKYRAAGAEVIQCISEFVNNVERASIDEAYVDITGLWFCIVFCDHEKFVTDFVTEQLEQNTHSMTLDTTPTDEAYVMAQHRPYTQSSDVRTVDSTSCNALSESLNRPDWKEFLIESFADGERYALASALTYHIRKAILRRTGFRCSAGVAPNKVSQ